ncbi:unnamed protein product, partial [Musa acuminata subsp. burmannicoides]
LKRHGLVLERGRWWACKREPWGRVGRGEACCSLAAVESSSFCGSRTLWCCTHSHEMDTFYLFMSPYVNRTEMIWPKGIYELRAVRSMQCTDIWDEYSSLDA